MITLAENAVHQVTMLGTGMLAEARAGHVDVAGWRLLDAPVVEMLPDGTITLRIAVAEAAPKRAKKADQPNEESAIKWD